MFHPVSERHGLQKDGPYWLGGSSLLAEAVAQKDGAQLLSKSQVGGTAQELWVIYAEVSLELQLR